MYNATPCIPYNTCVTYNASNFALCVATCVSYNALVSYNACNFTVRCSGVLRLLGREGDDGHRGLQATLLQVLPGAHKQGRHQSLQRARQKQYAHSNIHFFRKRHN